MLGPVLAALAVIGALVARIKIEIVREEPEAMGQDVQEVVRNVKKKVEDATSDQ
jgi:hypothetical protein